MVEWIIKNWVFAAVTVMQLVAFGCFAWTRVGLPRLRERRRMAAYAAEERRRQAWMDGLVAGDQIQHDGITYLVHRDCEQNTPYVYAGGREFFLHPGHDTIFTKLERPGPW